ncbi:MAG TPA: hypothetical protein V6C86_04690 [Oculatellaceae cyanobacterium]
MTDLEKLAKAIDAYGEAERRLGQAMATPGAKEYELINETVGKHAELLEAVANWRVS